MDAKLVNLIVQRVVEALKAQGLAAPLAPASPKPQPAQAPAPASDYGPRRPLTLHEHTAGGNAVLYRPGKKTSTPAPAPARVFVTAEMLAQRVAAGTGGSIQLAHNEFLTPAALDLVDVKHWTVTKTPKAAVGASQNCPLPAAPEKGDRHPPNPPSAEREPVPALGLVVVKPTERTQTLLSALEREGVKTASFNQTDCWMCNVEVLCAALAAGQVKAGLVLAPFAADAMLLAGKHKGVRPVQGARADSVAAGVRHFDANVLVLEHAVSAFHEMRQMVRLFAAPRGEANFVALLEKVAAREARP